MTDTPTPPFPPEDEGVEGQPAGRPAADPGIETGGFDAPAEARAEAESEAGGASEAELEAEMLAMLDEQDTSSETPAADFVEFHDAVDGQTDPAALSLLYDLSLPVAVELGRTRMSVQEVLALGRGSVVQLDRLAGEPIDVFVGDRRFAEGEVVVLGEQFGVRITRVINPAQANGKVAEA